jgi:hypothetical protein
MDTSTNLSDFIKTVLEITHTTICYAKRMKKDNLLFFTPKPKNYYKESENEWYDNKVINDIDFFKKYSNIISREVQDYTSNKEHWE